MRVLNVVTGAVVDWVGCIESVPVFTDTFMGVPDVNASLPPRASHPETVAQI